MHGSRHIMNRLTGRTPRAFTLIEMLIVIGIIVILAALTTTVGLRLLGASEEREAEDLMRVLTVAVDEWELDSQRSLAWGEDGLDGDGIAAPRARYEIQSTTMHPFHIVEVVGTLNDNARVKDVVQGINPRYLQQLDDALDPLPNWTRLIDPNDPCACTANSIRAEYLARAGEPEEQLTIVDPWGTPLRVIHPGAVYRQGVSFGDPDADGTLRTPLEDMYGVARNRRLVFISAGPDQKFGDLRENNDPESAAFVATQDNLYSGELVVEYWK
ncbi:MAG: prepilin-type N-terminal cleavage/methylation domain-containing protein [Planctomycetota bacterium]